MPGTQSRSSSTHSNSSHRNRNRNRSSTKPPPLRPATEESAAGPFLRRAGLFCGAAAFALLLLLPPPAGLPPAGWHTLAVAALTATFWILEPIPIPAASVLPLVLLPVLGVLTPKEAAAPFADPLIFLLGGGFILALGLERAGLHRRLALHAVRLFGVEPRRLVLGFMATTAAISVWISNTATTLLMLPIAIALVENVERQASSPPRGEGWGEGAPDRGAAGPRGFGPALYLGIAYAASIGGMGSLIGTPPNAICASTYAKLFPDAPRLTFAAWMAVGIPIAAALTPVAWLVLTRFAFKVPVASEAERAELGAVLARKVAALGPWRPEELRIAAVFATAAVLWIWGPWWARSDSTVAVAAALALFLIPSGRPAGGALIDWPTAARLPWGMLILFGGGLAIAVAFESSGLSAWLGGKVTALRGAPTPLVLAVISIAVVAASEVASNTALTALLMPIVASAAPGLGLPPLLLMVTVTLAASCGFVLPVATAPNAIAYGTGRVTTSDMARAGLPIDLVGALLVASLVYVLAPLALPL